MSLPISDDFNRSNQNPLAGNYTKMTGMNDQQLVSNQVGPTGGGADTAVYWNADTPNADQWASIDVAVLPTGDGVGVLLRCSTTANTCYPVYLYNGDQAYIDRHLAGSVSTVGGGNATYTVTVNVYGEAVGARLLLRVGSTVIANVTDVGGIGSGMVGIYIFPSGAGLTARADNFAANNFFQPAGVNYFNFPKFLLREPPVQLGRIS